MFGKLNEDGTLSSANKKHEGFISLDQFAKDENGEYYKYYKADLSADLEKTQQELDQQHNEEIYKKLEEIDKKKPRALTDAVLGNDTYLHELEDQAKALREQLR